MNKQNFLTLQGKQKLEMELHQLVTVDREAIKQSIAEARALGDLSENAEYQVAKEKQSHLEGRIQYLQSVLASSQVIDPSKGSGDKIIFGATIKVYDLNKEEEITFQIVGQEEADTQKGKISFLSPLGKAMIGKSVGDSVVVQAPKGNLEYEVQEILFV